MKKAKMKINFQNNIINAFSEDMPLLNAISRNYAILFTQATQFINGIDRESSIRVTLMVTKKSNDTKTSLSISTSYI